MLHHKGQLQGVRTVKKQDQNNQVITYNTENGRVKDETA
jgi:hypothetical protein